MGEESWQAFRIYLEKAGTIKSIQKVLMKLYDTKERPENPLHYIIDQLNKSYPDVAKIKAEAEKPNIKAEEILQEFVPEKKMEDAGLIAKKSKLGSFFTWKVIAVILFVLAVSVLVGFLLINPEYSKYMSEKAKICTNYMKTKFDEAWKGIVGFLDSKEAETVTVATTTEKPGALKTARKAVGNMF